MEPLQFRVGTEEDSHLLAEMNRQLIQDEGHRNPMTYPELKQRMNLWLQQGYTAIIFEQHGVPVAYALYRQDLDSIYLRQFFVERHQRCRGIGRQAIQILLSQIWLSGQRIRLEVLKTNRAGQAFWKAMGFQEYSTTLEMDRSQLLGE